MPFNPKSEYTIVSTEFSIKDFFDYKTDYVTRPPYQRKAVWSKIKKQNLMDSLFRRYYIPKLVIREVRLSDYQTISEVIDGQQRINAVQEFFNNQYPLPKTLSDVDDNLSGLYYKDLDTDIRKFIDKSLKYQADVIKNIDKPHDVNHQIIATEIFWRLQQGETLNYMEVAHAQLSSLTRNFIVKYADDQTFDYEKYEPIDENPDKGPFFFTLLSVDNIRMKHLQFMARFLMIEQGSGYADLSDRKIEELINDAKQEDGIGNITFENQPEAKATRQVLKAFYEIFKDDPMLDSKCGIKKLSVEYFIISIYLLIRHLRLYYVFDDKIKTTIRAFIYGFYKRWRTFDESTDTDLLTFSNRRQQGESDLEVRDIMRQIFFEYLKEHTIELIDKDEKRAFTELERVLIYRKGKGFCQQCLEENQKLKAKVSWSQYQADHVLPHGKGGRTVLDNGELLCSYHNQSKGAKIK